MLSLSVPSRFDDFYFLTDPEEFIDSHFPDEEKWQLLDIPISLEEFERRAFKTSAFFSMGLRLIRPHHCHIVTGYLTTFLFCSSGQLSFFWFSLIVECHYVLIKNALIFIFNIYLQVR